MTLAIWCAATCLAGSFVYYWVLTQYQQNQIAMQLFIGNHMFSLSLAAMLAIVAGCASNNATSTGADFSTDVTIADSKNTQTTDEVVTPVSHNPARSCRMRRVTGSHIARQQCFTKQQKKDLEQASKSLLRTGGSRGGAYRVPSQSDPRDN